MSDPPFSDEAVDDDVLVYRLIPTTWCSPIDGEWQFQSGAFDNASPDERGLGDMSVVLGDTLEAAGRVPEQLPGDTSWADPDQWGVAALEVTFLRNEEEQIVLRTPEDDEPAHGDVRGAKGQKRRRRLKKHARWIVPPQAPTG